ncbi:nucleotidyltransferase domain-containing protein [Planomicrobium sp. CPCC 101110]|uniref:nucleotidyltransferase domain-containing protein n=1 Tax=Planomicrobium sp. CPCC 101110 TaxID=2599619 RepID=UPI0011B7B889|nr:nucleotidyltransferase domain-containing protein [Planomicrobium sp. CPCC 101110]TWT28461.1 nucleotidyltransferase domain-containing protein [Planomicrobium sp. CPCC 101110]
MARPCAEKAAAKFVARHFPLCQCAVLAGSTVRGEATSRSDLDIVVFDEHVPAAYRESFVEEGWPIEAFIHNFTSYQAFFESDCRRGRPSLPKMVAEGVAIIEDARLKGMKAEAKRLLEKGPEPWPAETIRSKRYFLTDLLDDFIGSSDRMEDLFIAGALAEAASEFVLRTNRQWIGQSKWIMRALRNFNPDFAKQFSEGFDDFYLTGNKEKIIALADLVLRPYGGRLFSGFSLGKPENSALNKDGRQEMI